MVGCENEVVRMREEFKENHSLKSDIPFEEHHEDMASFCNRFQTDVSTLVEVFQKYSNSFKNRGLTAVNNIRIVLPKNVRSLLQRQFSKFVEDSCLLRTALIHTVRRKQLNLGDQRQVRKFLS